MLADRFLRRRLLASALVGQFLFGIVLALLGTLFGIPAATERMGLGLDGRAGLLVTLFTGQLVFTALAGRFVDRWGSTRVLGAGSLLMAAGLAGTAGADGFVLAATATILMAAGGAAVNAASNVLVSMLYGERRGPMLNVLGMAGALGALSVPFVFAGASSWTALAGRLLGLAAAGTAAGVGHLFQPVLPAAVRASSLRGRTTRSILSDRWVLALTALLILDFGTEAVMAGWITTYTLGVLPGSPATVMVGLYWGALMAGRLAGLVVLARVRKLPFVGLAAALTTIGLVGIAGAWSPAALGAAVLVTGFAIAPLAPTIMSLAGDRFTTGTGAVFGIMLSLGQIGGMLVPWTVAQVTQAAGYRPGMLVAAGGTGCMVAIAAMLLLRTGTEGHRRRAVLAPPAAPQFD